MKAHKPSWAEVQLETINALYEAKERAWDRQVKFRNRLIIIFPPGHQFEFAGKQMTVVCHTLIEGASVLKAAYWNHAGELRHHEFISTEFPLSEWIADLGEAPDEE